MPIIPIENEDHWHKMRDECIGASDIAALFGCGSSWTPTPNELYHIRRGNLPGRKPDTLLTALGKAMEPFIAYVVTDMHGWRLERCQRYHTHPDLPVLGCTLDYDVIESEHGPGILEIKNVQNFAPGWTKERAPDHVELQLQHQFLVVNAARAAEGLKPYKWGAIGSLHAGNPEDVRVMLRTPDLKVHKHIMDRAGKFMAAVRDGIEPPLMGSDDYQHIVDLFKAAEIIDPDMYDARDDAILDAWAAEYLDQNGQKKAAEIKTTEMKTRILHRMIAERVRGQIERKTVVRTKNYALITNVTKGNQLRFEVKVADA